MLEHTQELNQMKSLITDSKQIEQSSNYHQRKRWV